jgi:HlyD family secretion protein
MKKFWRIFWIVLVVGIMVLLVVFLWNKTRPVKVVYEITTPVMDTIRQYVVATGKVEPRDEVLIKPQIPGIISSVLREAGDMIKEGEVIATVKVIPEMSALSSSESRVNQAQISLDQTTREYERMKVLYDNDAVTLEELERMETELKSSKEDLQNAKDNLEIVLNGIASRNAEMSNTQIRSTIEGMILDVPVKVGNSVIQSNTFNDGTTIASIANMGNMLFRGNVDETDVGKLHTGVPVKLTVGAMQDVELDAVLEYVSPKALDDNGMTMFEVKAAVTVRDDVFIRAGYSANASILIESRDNIITLPESLVSFEAGKSYVYVLTSTEDAEEQTFEKREVELGLSDGIKIEVKSGITVDDKVRGAIKQDDKFPTKVEIRN